MSILHNDWQPLLAEEFEQPYYKELREFLKGEYRTRTVYPNMHDIFNALHLTSYADVKVVILGQDPYHGAGQAHGLSFSVKPGVPAPPSLQNMFKELRDDLGCFVPNNGYLVRWAEQGVLMLNTVLTVREATPNSHKGKGWERFTDRVIYHLNLREQPIVFILWGSHAQAKMQLITNPQHHVLRSPHPSPLSAHRGFFGSKPFSKANGFLTSIGLEPIDWQIPNL
ncbi:uracil-DNA glycosylase [Paenibacillus doosanensis]|uniref:Uracil-DNA glycosylase n=1 Tax=Paenibacillus konkukensis TaxID=2020716 RepID=A0ABY4RLB5_9BACL|nr:MULTISPECIES: uracil-DNA glycosylase [Paenibacillus]MCS7460162.1 uracil-DNA glycosylase [Paenibacillus doosanensis]UQZ82820.1 Uracil-DNA glycosylase [Paenibacillus konkukensis]